MENNLKKLLEKDVNTLYLTTFRFKIFYFIFLYLEDPRLKFLEPDDCFNAYYTQKLKLYATIKRLEQTAPSKSNSKCNYEKLIIYYYTG